MGGMCHNTQCMSSRSPIRVPMMTPVHLRKHLQWAQERQTGPRGSGKRLHGPMSPVFFYITWTLFEEHDKEFKVSLWPPNYPDHNSIEHL